MNHLVQPVGRSLPPDTPHAISVSLPTWESCVAYEEGEDWVLGRMQNGYPRFFIDPLITAFAEDIVRKFGLVTEQAILLPSHATAARCVDFLTSRQPVLKEGKDLSTVVLTPITETAGTNGTAETLCPLVVAVVFPRTCFPTAKSFWQHTGEGISSRRAEVFHKAFLGGHLMVSRSAQSTPHAEVHMTAPIIPSSTSKGPQRYRKRSFNNASHAANCLNATQSPARETNGTDGKDHVQFVEERFGRNLNSKLANSAKVAIRRRIAGALIADLEPHETPQKIEVTGLERGVAGFSVDDVYLYPSGMSSIFNTHRTLMKCRGALRSICFGFPYIDTLKILEKWGPGCVFYGHGSSADIDDLEERCKAGEQFLALFCEFPGNPLLKSPDVCRLRLLAERYNFAIVIDETIGNFLNVNVLPHADVIVSSLTKVFSGDSNVMGGSSVLNPIGHFYRAIKLTMEEDYEDNYWLEDAIFMERNSRDFASRIQRINMNAEAICNELRDSPIARQLDGTGIIEFSVLAVRLWHARMNPVDSIANIDYLLIVREVKEVYYPKYSPTRLYYDQCRTPTGGYGGLLSITFWSTSDAIVFFDALATAKGPSLGTNFTLSCPFVLLAHYGELDWAAQFGAEADLVRISVGLEDAAHLSALFRHALDAVSASRYSNG